MASSKSNPLTYWLIAFVTLSVILSVAFYLNYKEYVAATAAANAARSEASTAATNLRKAVDEITLLKRALGYANFDNVGSENDPNPNTVTGALLRDLNLYGRSSVQPSPAAPTVAATLQALRAELNSVATKAAELNLNVVSTQNEMTAERTAHSRQIAELTNSQTNSEIQLTDLVNARNELLSGKDTEISKFRQDFLREQREKETLRDELELLRKETNEKLQQAQSTIDQKKRELEQTQDMSFEKADGAVIRVENLTRTVWVNLGSDDGLRSQISFAVYTKDNDGLGRRNNDIKAKIQISRVLGPNLSEAVILSEDLKRPIRSGDPIYSPAWQKGQKEYFSFVGILDMTGDGISDRELLRNVMSTNGAGIEVEVDDQGRRIPENAKLTPKTKFLVLGELLDPSEFPGSDLQKQEEIAAVRKQNDDLTADANRLGIRIVNLRDFLNYMGYESNLRVYSRDSLDYTLRSGTSPTPSEKLNDPDRAKFLKTVPE